MGLIGKGISTCNDVVLYSGKYPFGYGAEPLRFPLNSVSRPANGTLETSNTLPDNGADV